MMRNGINSDSKVRIWGWVFWWVTFLFVFVLQIHACEEGCRSAAIWTSLDWGCCGVLSPWGASFSHWRICSPFPWLLARTGHRCACISWWGRSCWLDHIKSRAKPKIGTSFLSWAKRFISAPVSWEDGRGVLRFSLNISLVQKITCKRSKYISAGGDAF